MAPKRLPDNSVQDLQHLHGRVKRRRPQPKIKRPPDYYQNLIEQHDTAKTVIPNAHADATKDNVSGIESKFAR